MKILYVTACIVVISASCFSQTMFDQGQLQIGTVLGLSASNTEVEVNGTSNEGSKAFQLNFSPKFGYFALDNFVAGIGFDYTFNKEESQGFTESDGDFLFGPYMQGFLPMGNGSKAFFFEVNFGFGSTKDVNELIGLENSTKVFAVGFGPGFTVIANDGWIPIGLETSVKYNIGRSTSNLELNGVDTEILTRTGQWDFSVGIVFYLNT